MNELVKTPASPWLDGLNTAQSEAVKTLDGPLLVLSGAGTGKTRVLTSRLAELVASGTAKPWNILAVTFTNKAAREMKLRVASLVGPMAEQVWLGTFHALAAKMLRRHADLVGLRSDFTILDTDDQIRLLKQLMESEDIDPKRWPARMLGGVISRWKDRGLPPEKVGLAEAGDIANGRVRALYERYQTRLIALNAVDFGDLLLHMLSIFTTHADVLADYQNRITHIMVDEYQDTNVAQYLWLRLLTGNRNNLCCVGDDDQSIYGWRGAEVGNILRFETDFPGSHVVRLEQNYRSTPHILAAASAVIDGNKGRLGKTLWTEKDEGEKLRLIGHWDGEEEARWIGEEIEAAQRGTRGQAAFDLDSMAILVRASHQMRAFEDRFLTIGLPYRVIGGPRFYERMEIRDAMAYFRLAVSTDDDLAFERVVNTPKRGLGDKAQQKIQTAARSNGVSLVEGARILLAAKDLGGKGAVELARLIDGIDRWHAQVRQQADTHVELAEIILDESGYTNHWQNDKTPEAPGRLENLKELVKALEGFENLQGFLEHVSLIMDNEQQSDGAKVSIMTLHAAKGLEFPMVFLPGWEDGLFPSQRSMDESGLKGLEEERRLAYVGITRAEEICTISFAANRRVYGQWQSALPSRFIDELPSAHVDVLTPPGLYGGSFGAAGMAASANPAVQEAAGSGIFERASKADVYNSPGWRRLQERSGQRGMRQPAQATHVTIDMTAVSAFSVGDRVFHQKFGYGEVLTIEGDKLGIEFDKAGSKKVVAQYIQSANTVGDAPF